MQRRFNIALVFTLVVGSVLNVCAQASEKPFVVVIPSYNNAQYCQKNLESVRAQKYSNYRVIYVDDASSDNTGKLVKKFIKDHGMGRRVTYKRNKNRILAMHNLYHAIHSCRDEEIIVNLDGDDWLAHDKVLQKLNEVYQDPDVWLTYGQYEYSETGDVGHCSAYPDEVIAHNNFRGDDVWRSSQPRTLYAGIFKKIEHEDFLCNGTFYPVVSDVAYFYPALELAGSHGRFVAEVLYVYNYQNPARDGRNRLEDMRVMGNSIRFKRRYKPLKTLQGKAQKEPIADAIPPQKLRVALLLSDK